MTRVFILTALTTALTLSGGTAAWSEPIIADHRAVSDFDRIPAYWLEKAKLLTLHYAHTSHGSQINSGLGVLETLDPAYSVAIWVNSSSAALPPMEIPAALRIYDGNPPETYISPDDYWDGEPGLNRTRSVAGTGLFNFSMWSWCGQQSSNPVEKVEQYLAAIETLEAEYPDDMRFIYMTGHTDGGSATLARNNQMVRDHVIAHDKVLYDFADIESWDPAGNYYPNTGDGCSWCSDWCAEHPLDCDFTLDSCAHSHKFNCLIKAKAFWWLMARLAGWDGACGTELDADADGDVDGRDLAAKAMTCTGQCIETLAGEFGAVLP